MTVTIDISPATLIRRLAFITFLAALAVIAYHAQLAVSMLVVAAFVAIAINTPVSWLSARLPTRSRKLATLAVFTLIGAVIALVVALIVPVISEQGRELAQLIPLYLQQLQAGDNVFGRWLAGFDLAGGLDSAIDDLSTGFIVSADAILDILNRLVTNLFTFLFTVVLIFLMAVEGPHWYARLLALVPKKSRESTAKLSKEMYGAVTGFVGGQLIITSIAATATLILLLILGVPAPVSLAAVIWVTGLVPLVGNTLGALVVIAVGLTQSLGIALFLAGYYIVYQQVENNVLEPIVQSRTIHMTPLFILISAIIGIFVAGFVGALLAIPAGACIKILAKHLLNKRGVEASATA